jgi:hypothetical protein
LSAYRSCGNSTLPEFLASSRRSGVVRYDVGFDARTVADYGSAAETDDAWARQAIDEAFVAGYRIVLWVASGLAVASSLTAAMMITTKAKSSRKAQ